MANPQIYIFIVINFYKAVDGSYLTYYTVISL